MPEEKKVYVLIKAFELIVENVEVWTDRKKAEESLKEWTKGNDYPNGLTEEEISKHEEEEPEFKYSQSQIIETSVRD